MRLLLGNMPDFNYTPSDADAILHLANVTLQDTPLKIQLEELILALKAAGIWTKLDVLSVVHKNLADSLLNIKDPTGAIGQGVAYGTITYVTDIGLKSNGTVADYIELSGDNPSTDYPNFLDTDAHMMTYSQDAVTGELLNVDGISSLIYSASDALVALQSGVTVTLATKIAGFFAATIASITDRYMAQNETFVQDSVSKISPGVGTAAPYLIYSTGGAGTGDTISAWSIGGDLTDTEMQAFELIIRTYLTARGAEVYP